MMQNDNVLTGLICYWAKDEMARRLIAVCDACRNIPYRTKQTIQQVDSNIADLKKKGDPEVSEASDELECAANIVRNQFPIRRFLDTYFVPSFSFC